VGAFVWVGGRVGVWVGGGVGGWARSVNPLRRWLCVRGWRFVTPHVHTHLEEGGARFVFGGELREPRLEARHAVLRGHVAATAHTRHTHHTTPPIGHAQSAVRPPADPPSLHPC
jgi:hypothetical protein